MPQSVAMIGNGEIQSPSIIRRLILRHTRCVAIDGGLIHCAKMNIQPHVIVGDFDSCPKELLEKYRNVSKISLKKGENETDLEVAVAEIAPQQITLYGAWGYRIDHSLTNILLLTRYPGIKIETESEIVFSIGGSATIECKPGQTVSLIPINGPVTVTTEGLKWELQDGKLDKNFVGISNIALKEKVQINVKEGNLVCCLNKPKEERL